MKKVISIILIALCLSPTYMDLAATTMQVVQENNVEETTYVEDTSNDTINEEVVATPHSTSVSTEENIVEPLAVGTIDLSSPVSGAGYTVDDVNKTITFDTSANGQSYELIGSTTEYRVIVPTSVDTTIVLNGVTMQNTYSPIEVSGGTLNLEVAAGTTNTITCTGNTTDASQAGIEINNSGNLLIDGSGNLNATGGMQGPGIGVTIGAVGTIEISGDVVVHATGGVNGAGIGTGYTDSTSDPVSTISAIKILGNANVTATGGENAAGIGTGYITHKGATISAIEISGNAIVSAYGGNYGAGIGTGFTTNQGPYPISEITSILIQGNATVNAYGSNNGAGIGTGNTESATSKVVTIEIGEDSIVNISEATSGESGARSAAIGTGNTYSAITSVVTIDIIDNATINVDPNAEYMTGIGTGLAQASSSNSISAINILNNATVNAYGLYSGIGVGQETSYGNGVVTEITTADTAKILAVSSDVSTQSITDNDNTGASNIANISINPIPAGEDLALKVYDQDNNIITEFAIPYYSKNIAITTNANISEAIFNVYDENDAYVGTLVKTTDLNSEITPTTDYSNITPVILYENSLPISETIEVTIKENESITIALKATDLENHDLTFDIVTNPTNGTVVNNNDGTVTYTPYAGFTGIDTFTYVSNDGFGNSNESTVTIIVEPINTLPTTDAINVTTLEDEAKEIKLLGTDTDNQNLIYEITSNPTSGTIVNNNDGTVTYTPNANFNGTDTFTYVANDGFGNSNESTVTITVESINDMPISETIEVTTSEDESITITLKGIDIDSQDLTFEITSNPTNGTIVNNGNGTVTYTPNAGFSGTDTFTYVVNDGFGNSNESTVTIIVEPKIVNIDDSNKNDEETNSNEDNKSTLEETNSNEDDQSTLEETGSEPFVIFFAIAVSALAIALYTRFKTTK